MIFSFYCFGKVIWFQHTNSKKRVAFHVEHGALVVLLQRGGGVK